MTFFLILGAGGQSVLTSWDTASWVQYISTCWLRKILGARCSEFLVINILANAGSSNQSHRTAWEMLKLVWHPNFRHKNTVIAIFTDVFYLFHSVFSPRLAGSDGNSTVPINLKHEIQLGILCSSARLLFLENKLYIVVRHYVQFTFRNNKGKQMPCLGLVIISLPAQWATGLWDSNSCFFCGESSPADPWFIFLNETKGAVKSPKIVLSYWRPLVKKYIGYKKRQCYGKVGGNCDRGHRLVLAVNSCRLFHAKAAA